MHCERIRGIQKEMPRYPSLPQNLLAASLTSSLKVSGLSLCLLQN